MPQATVWVCLYHPGDYTDTSDLSDIAEQVRLASVHWQQAAVDLAALAAAGFELEYDSSEREIIDIAARAQFASLEEAETAANATGVHGRIMDFEDDSVCLGEGPDLP